MAVVSQTPTYVLDWRKKRDKELGYLEDAAEVWKPWMQAVSEHRWRFLPESPCQSCGQLTTSMEAGQPPMTLCIECLNSGSPDFPTGWAMPDGTTYVRHSESCTSHSSFPTSSSSMLSEEASLRRKMGTSRTSESSPTFSSARRTKNHERRSSSTPSSPSASLKPMSLNSRTRRN